MILSKRYNEEINKIVMNDDMKKRILQNVLNASENGDEKNIKVETTLPKVKKSNNIKRNMQAAAAGFTVILCLSIAKAYPMLLKSAPDGLKQNEASENHDDENNDLKSSDDNEVVNNEDSKEVSGNNKEDQTLNQNKNNHNSGDGSKKEENNASSEIETEEKNKYNSQSNSGSEVVQSQAAPTDDNKATGNSNISSKTNTEEAVNNKGNSNVTRPETQTPPGDKKENRNVAGTKPKAESEDAMLDKMRVNNTDNNVSENSVMSAEDVNYNQEYKTLDEAEKALNLKVNSLKTVPKGYEMENVSTISNEIIQVDYNNGNSNITFRAGIGTDNISGDYNVYQVKKTVKVNGLNVNLEGNKSEEYNLAVWEKDGISYSISAENGIDEKTILDMIS
ncbi:hypothetical protein CDLVIII_3749 [Clostridium sp. DL-VIII]|uniref:hypothetical protein n=1 Tax=Clostridium sp. DL-VIII TaxID=641107 RepID=UPI00023AFEBE|nr:hypothetical protein [Clostridium sp. DL-VIII]EHJ00304.1 hypothetical protein CDLVIII_3749 [Clostridium sp. DL-VIII]